MHIIFLNMFTSYFWTCSHGDVHFALASTFFKVSYHQDNLDLSPNFKHYIHKTEHHGTGTLWMRKFCFIVTSDGNFKSNVSTTLWQSSTTPRKLIIGMTFIKHFFVNYQHAQGLQNHGDLFQAVHYDYAFTQGMN